MCPEGVAKLAGLQASGRIAAIPQGSKPPAPCGSTRPPARLHAARLKMREAVLPRDRARSAWAIEVSVPHFRAPVAPQASLPRPALHVGLP